MKCPTNLLSDVPESSDSFGPHRRVAQSIVELVRNEKGGKSIGLEGSYGSGKTTVVNLIHSELKEDSNYLLIPFDVWAHEGDPLRRTFLEALIRRINAKKWINEDEWNNRLNEIARRREIKSTKTIPLLKPLGKAIGLSLFLVPFGIAFVNAALRENLTFNPWLPASSISWKFIIGTILTLFPLLVLGFRWLSVKRRHRTSGATNEDADLWAMLFSKSITEEQTETTKTPDPTSIEFEDTFKDLMYEALAKQERRILLVLDNLDRVDPKDALSIWSTLQTFLQHSPYSTNEWFERLWILVLYDPQGISRLWEEEEAPKTYLVGTYAEAPIVAFPAQRTLGKKTTITSSFLDKSFQIRFRVPPPMLSDWHTYLGDLLKQALPEHSQKEFHEVYRVLAVHSAKTGSVPTIRRLKLYVNQIGAIHRQWEDAFPLSHIAYYVLSHSEGDDSVQWFTTHPEREYQGFLDENIRESLAALAFNVERDRALQLLLNEPIKNALAQGEVESLKGLAEFRSGFWEVLEKVIGDYDKWGEGGNERIANAAFCLNESQILEKTERLEEAETVVKGLCDIASTVKRWSSLDKQKAKGIAALYKWNQDREFALQLLQAIPQSLFTREPNEYKFIDIKGMAEGLKYLHGEFESLGHVDLFSEGVITPLKSESGLFRVDSDKPTISAETNTILEVLFELHYFDDEANLYLSELVKDTGYILRRFHSTVSNMKDSVAEELISGVALCLFILLRAFPDATKQSIYIRWMEERNSLLKFLQLKTFETEDTTEEKTKLANSQKTSAVVKAFTDLLLQHNELPLLFRVLDAEPESQPFILYCLIYLVKDTAHAKSLFIPEIFIERWPFLYHEFTGSDYMYPTLFDTLVQRLSWETDLLKSLCETEFNTHEAGLYRVLAVNLGAEHSYKTRFVDWCKSGLQSINREQWLEELQNPRDLLRLALFLTAAGTHLNLGHAYKEALVKHAESVMEGNVAKDFVGGTPIIAKHPLSKLAEPLGQGAVREEFRRELFELVLNAGGAIDERFFFDIYEEELSDPDIVFHNEHLFSDLFIPLFNQRNARGLQWVANMLGSNPRKAKEPPQQKSAEEFKALVKTALEERTFNEAGPFLARIANFLGVKYNLGQPLPDRSKEQAMIDKPETVKRLEFRDQRLRSMMDGKALPAMPLDDHPWVILHMVPTAPLESSDIESKFDLSALAYEIVETPPELFDFRPIGASDITGGEIENGELVTYACSSAILIRESANLDVSEHEPKSAYSYLRILQDGTVEAVRTTYYTPSRRRIPESFKRDLLEAIQRYLRIQEQLGVQPPIAIILTLTGVKDHAPKETLLHFPEILVPSFEFRDETKLAELMEDIFSKIPVTTIG